MERDRMDTAAGMSPSTDDLRAPGRMAATLGYGVYAKILASTISTLDTPANVGIFAGWGSGKSFLMNKIKDIMEQKSRQYPRTNGNFFKCISMLFRLIFFIPPPAIKRSDEVRFITVYFNALEYAGSDHLWAGLVTRLVGAVEWGVGRLPSAIFRARPPYKMPLHCSTSNNPEKLRFRPRTLCHSKVPVYVLFIVVMIVCTAGGIVFFVYAINRQRSLQEENSSLLPDESNTTSTTAPLLQGDGKRSIALGSVIISIPIVAFCRSAVPITIKIINTHKAQITRMLSRPDFSKELGVMAKVKEEIRHLSKLVRFMELFEQRRIVVAIFIDDLDKLPQQNIAPLLQAIKILLTEPGCRFVSIIAMDPYSVSDALEMGIQSEFPAINISGHKFLKQMIQVPFSIPAMNSEEKSKLFRALQKRGRLSESQVAINTLNMLMGDEVDGTINKNVVPVELDGLEAGSDETPMLRGNSIHGNDVPEEAISMEEIHIDKPLDQYNSVVKACDHVMSELRNSQTFPFIKNNLQEMLRLAGIVKVTTRVVFCRLDHARKFAAAIRNRDDEPFGITPKNLAAWVVLVGQWPYRTTWVAQQVEDRDDASSPYPKSCPLIKVYRDVEHNFTTVTGWRKLIQLDGDPDALESFLNQHSTWLNVGFLLKLLPHTISLDRSLKSIVSWTSVERDLKTYNTYASKPLSQMNVEDVVLMINGACRGSKQLEEYAKECIEHNISGMVLLRGDLAEVKQCLKMNLGDWTLFSHALLQLRNVHKFKFSS